MPRHAILPVPGPHLTAIEFFIARLTKLARMAATPSVRIVAEEHSCNHLENY